jgi:hypothetical protein
LKEEKDFYRIDDRIYSVKFTCDIDICKGACCTLNGTLGAPLKEEEIDELRKAVEFTFEFLSPRNIEIIGKEGFYVTFEDKIFVNTVEDNDCVFSFYEDGAAKCSVQKAFSQGKTVFKKPVSCELFPIRVYGEKRNVIRYEKVYECDSALEKGMKTGTSIFDFTKSGIRREFGEEFIKEYSEIKY